MLNNQKNNDKYPQYQNHLKYLKFWSMNYQVQGFKKGKVQKFIVFLKNALWIELVYNFFIKALNSLNLCNFLHFLRSFEIN